MKRITFLLIAIIGFQIQIFSQPYKIPDSVKRIVFLGNSITYGGKYISYIDAYLTVKYPSRHIEIINVGLPSETVSGLSEPGHAGGKFPRPDLHERLERVLTQTKPDFVFACYGMNDGVYMPFDNERFKKYREGIDWLHDQVLKSGASIIHITTPMYDERKGKAYANVLDIYSDWLISLRYSSNLNVIDIHWPMKKYIEDKREVDSSFSYAKDGIHPNEIGHFIIAKQILLSLGEKELAKANNMKEALLAYQNGDTILRLVEKRQEIMKDAWLTQTGHKRPGMKIGLPIKEAEQKAEELNKQIQNFIKP
ncbi:SGNH/GDSL hydrolase family protein [Flavobacterium sp.]|uniref:SGNH/GDSL hydrolase family protein n=1 Tax=Flavobacterium sp. TaxID=239 RepID=UPI0038FD1DDA